MRMRVFITIGIGAALATAFLAGCQSNEDMSQADSHEPMLGFVGAQSDDWCAVTPDRIRVKSELTLRTRPAGKVPMPIELPYAKGQLDVVTVNSERLPFRKTGDGAYSIELPSDKQLGGQRRITCEWLLPISELKHESGLYWTRPRSLIPVVSYELRASVGPQSGFDLIGGPANAYSWNGDRPATEFDVGDGVCALPIRERE